ncbi:MAG: hypothetical protein AAFV53_37775 [Myxococcota bacterium]
MLLATLLLMLSSDGHAHAAAILETSDVLPPGVGGVGMGVEANFGLLWAEDEENYNWICHEAVTSDDAIVLPEYSRSSDGVFLVTVPALEQVREAGKPVYRSPDGCVWEPVTGLDDQVITKVEYAPTDPTQAIAVAANLDETVPSGIFRSTDGGQTFSAVFGVGGLERLFLTAVYRPDDAAQVWASASWFAGAEGYVYYSDDNGQTFTEHPIDVPQDDNDYRVFIIGVQPGVDATAWVAVTSFTRWSIYKTEDGGQTFTTVIADQEGNVTDGAADENGGLWVAVSGRTIHHAPPGGPLAPLERSPNTLGIEIFNDELLVAERPGSIGDVLTVADIDDQQFALRLHLSELNPPPAYCPEDSDTIVRCQPIWELVSARLPAERNVDTGRTRDTGTGKPLGDTASQNPDPSPSSCGCRDGGSAFLLGGLMILWKRRRDRD